MDKSVLCACEWLQCPNAATRLLLSNSPQPDHIRILKHPTDWQVWKFCAAFLSGLFVWTFKRLIEMKLPVRDVQLIENVDRLPQLPPNNVV